MILEYNRRHICYLLISLILLTFFAHASNSDHADGGCCRRPVECFECDSRFDARCGDPFNLTRETGPIKYCNDLCFKLKHRIGDKFYYIRSCADTLKKLYIKKTDVCYLTRTKDGGNLCFCDQELCNVAVTHTRRLFDTRNRIVASLSYGVKLGLQMFLFAFCSSTFYLYELIV